MGSDNTYYKAKEYWVTGQVVHTHGMVLRRLFHPDNLFVQPYTLLQNAIYAKAKEYLPDQDAERYFWQNIWFLYPYTREFTKPYLVNDKKYSPKMVRFLDTCWETIESMATMDISDPQIRTKSHFMLPILIAYYSQFQGHYNGPYWMSGFRSRNDKRCITRNYQMLKWLDELSMIWEKDHEWNKIQAKYAFALSFRQSTVIRLLNNLVLSLPLAGNFSCSHPLMVRMYKEYQDAMSTDPKRNNFLNLKKKNPKEASVAYQSTVYHPLGSAGNYFLEYICGKEMPKESYLLVNRKRDAYHEFYKYHRIESVFRNELKPILKERKNK